MNKWRHNNQLLVCNLVNMCGNIKESIRAQTRYFQAHPSLAFHHLFMAESPLTGLVAMRSRKGLDIIAGANQPSPSVRALSCSPDALGLKYLNHRVRWGEDQTVSPRKIRNNSGKK